MNTLSMKTWSTLRTRSVLAAAAVAAMLAAGCSTMAEPNSALDRAHASYRVLQADPQVTLLAPAEMSQAGEALRTADTAWTQREKQRTVDHLAYLAQQRIAIARETASTKIWENAMAAAKAGSVAEKARAETNQARGETDKARSDVAIAQRNTQDKTIQLAVAQAGAQQDKARATELEMQLKDLNAKQTDRGDVITLGDVLFDSNRAELRSGGLRDVTKLVNFFKTHPKRTALIEGFTDSQGSETFNIDLSQRRAAAVRDALIVQGVVSDRLSTHGYGEAYPASTNETVAGRQTNRRVEIVLSGEDGIVKAR
jgi:outer membrane protein OmpA-like peptidoglycan-associated protein